MDDENELDTAPPGGYYSSFVVQNPWLAYTISMTLMITFVLVGGIITISSKDFVLAGAGVGFTNRGSDLAGRIIAFNHLRRLECQGALMLTADGSKSNYFRHEVEPESDDPSDITEDMCYDGYMENGVRRRALHNHPERRRLDDFPWNGMVTSFVLLSLNSII